MPFYPVDSAPALPTSKPASKGRFVPVEEPSVGGRFEPEEPQAAQLAAPTAQAATPTTPEELVPGFIFERRRGLENPRPIDVPKFSPDIEAFLGQVDKATLEERKAIREKLASLPKEEREQIGDVVHMRYGNDRGLGLPYTDRIVQEGRTDLDIEVKPGAAGAFFRAASGTPGPLAGALAGASAGSRVPGPWWAKGGAALAGLGIGAYGGMKAQERAEAAVLGEEQAQRLARQRAMDIEAQPGATFAGEVVPSFAFLRPSASGLRSAKELASKLLQSEGKDATVQAWRSATPEARAYLVNASIGSGLDATVQTVRESFREDGIDLEGVGRIIAAAGIGASQVDPTKLGRGFGLRPTIDAPPPRVADLIPAEKALAGITDTPPAQVRTPIDDFMARATADRPPVRSPRDLDAASSSIPLDEAGRAVTGAEPTGIRIPDLLTAEEAAAQGLPLQRDFVARNAQDEAAMAAGRQAEEAGIRGDTENAIQELVLEWSRVTGRPYEGLVNFRKGKSDLEFMQYVRGEIAKAEPTAGRVRFTEEPAPTAQPEAPPAPTGATGEVAVNPAIASKPIYSNLYEGDIPVTIRRADGSIEEATFKGYWDFPGNPENIGHKLEDGEWSHGPMPPGDRIIESSQPLPPRPGAEPTTATSAATETAPAAKAATPEAPGARVADERMFDREIKRTGVIATDFGSVRVAESDAIPGAFDVVMIRDGKRTIASDPAQPTSIADAQVAAVKVALNPDSAWSQPATRPTDKLATNLVSEQEGKQATRGMTPDEARDYLNRPGQILGFDEKQFLNSQRKGPPPSVASSPEAPPAAPIAEATPAPTRPTEAAPAPAAAEPTQAGSPVFTRDEITVSKPSTSRRKRATGTDGEVRVEIRAPGKITSSDNWNRLADITRTRATVEARLDFQTGASPSKTEAVWVVRGGEMGNESVIARNLTYKDAIEAGKDFVDSANARPARETVTPTTDPVVGTDINGTPIQQSSKGVYYTFENGRVRTGPAFAEPGPTTPDLPARTTPQAGSSVRDLAEPTTSGITPDLPSQSAPASPTGRITFEDWNSRVNADNVDDIPQPYTTTLTQRKAVEAKVKELRAKRSKGGFIRPTPGLVTAGGGAGGFATGFGYGLTQGDTPEERIENALLYGTTLGAAGAGAGFGLSRLGRTQPGHRVGTRLGTIEDLPIINEDISNIRLRLQRVGAALMRGSQLRKPFFEAMRRTEAGVASRTDEAKIILADARGKINRLAPKGPQREALEAKLNEVFADITKVGELPAELQPLANRIYKIRLDNAAEIAALEGVTDATRNTVLENGGDYLARSYSIFHLRDGLESRAYRASLPKADVEAALDAIQEAWKPKPKTQQEQKLAADMLAAVAQDRQNAVPIIKSLRPWMTDDDAARMAAWIAGGKQGGSDVGRKMRALYTELINPSEVSRDEARVLLNEFLDRDNLAGFTVGRKNIGGKDVTSLYHKKEIDPRLRKVLGEVKDPLENAHRSIQNQVNIIERDKQQREFIRIGEAMGIMTRDPDIAAQKGMRPFVESGTKLNDPYDNYDGVFIYPWLRDEFKGSVLKSDDVPRVADVTLKGIKTATALFKWLKLIPAPDSRSVNLVGAWWNNAINGKGINPVSGKTRDGAKAVLMANGILSPDNTLNTQRLLALRQILVRHRVLDESVLGQDFVQNFRKSLFGDAFDKIDEIANANLDDPLARKAYSAAKFVGSGREFAAGDDIFRVARFLSEINDYKKAFPRLSQGDIEEVAGRIMNQTGMTYSEVPFALRELSQLGVIEPFVNFPYSVYRSTANTARLGAAELADGLASGNTELTKIGAKRLTALGLGLTAASGIGVAMLANRQNGVTPEQEEAAKVFAPDYVRDSPLAFDSPIKDGKASFVQMNYLLPSALITQAFEDGLAKAKEDGLPAGVGAGVKSVASQFTGMLDQDRPQVAPVPRTIGVALGLINEDSFGRPIYNPQDPDKWKKIAKTIGYDWSPGFWSKATRLYKANNPAAQDPTSPRVYSNKEEFLRFLGRRATTVDAKQVLPSKAYQLNEDYQNAVRLYQEGVRKTGTEGPEAEAAYGEATAVVTEKFNEFVRLRDAARLMGVNDDTIIAGFVRSGMSRKLIGQVMQSVNIPPPKEMLDARIEKRNAERQAYRGMGGGNPQAEARALVQRVRASGVPQEQFLRALETEWRNSGLGVDASGMMTKEFADALKAEIENR